MNDFRRPETNTDWFALGESAVASEIECPLSLRAVGSTFPHRSPDGQTAGTLNQH